jgi:hypothetical protein
MTFLPNLCFRTISQNWQQMRFIKFIIKLINTDRLHQQSVSIILSKNNDLI